MAKIKVPVEYLTKKEITSDQHLFIEKLMKLRDDKKQWEAIDEIVRFFKKFYPIEYKESVDISRGLRKTRGDKWGRGHKDLHKEARQANLRMVMNLPFRLTVIIRKVYTIEELPFDRKFLRIIAEKYPEILVPEKGVNSISK